MRKLVVLSSAVAITLTACGPKKLALPGNPIDRAATCAVISAASSREGATSLKGDLDYAAQTRIIHYAMLAGSEGKAFKASDASAVVARMNALSGEVTEGKWQELQAPCEEAYPLVAKTEGVELPASRYDAQLGCYAMADFLMRSVKSSGKEAEARQIEYATMRRKLDGSVASGLKAHGAGGFEQGQAQRNEALARMTNLGSPVATMKLCTAKFG